MNKRFIRLGAGLCALLLSYQGCMAVAEERHLGDYIYVPAMTAQQSVGSISLRVEGVALDESTGESMFISSLAGAQFGVYVISSSGQMTPWANPLYPSEPMRIRTGETAVSFALPQGTEFYLRQESAPEGYTFDSQTLIPVTQGEIVVQNVMQGQMVITAQTSSNEVLAGVTLTAADETGEAVTLVTNEQGKAVLRTDSDRIYTVRETALPDGVYAAHSVFVDGLEQDAAQPFSVMVERAKRSEVTFIHPSAGTVQLQMLLDVLDENGEAVQMPMPNVRMEILGDLGSSIVTDENGQAQTTLLEGTYTVRFSYEGAQDVVLPLSEGHMIVQSDKATVINISAKEKTGRVTLALDRENISGGSMTLVSTQNEQTFGPYAMDEDGTAVSDALMPGSYLLYVQAPDGAQIGALRCGEDTSGQPLAVRVESGSLTQANAQLLVHENQTFEVLRTQIGESGEIELSALELPNLTMVNASGETVSGLSIKNGRVHVEALSGSYALVMEDSQAQRLGIRAYSESFTLPSDEETIRFDSLYTRLILTAVDDRGMPISGASYRLTDSAGTQVDVQCDADGEAVTPLLIAGEIRIEGQNIPEEHDACAAQTVIAFAERAQRVQLVHERFGVAYLSVLMQSLDESGNEVRTPLAGVDVRLYRMQVDGTSMTDTGLTLRTGPDGRVSVQLEAGEYVAQVLESTLNSGCTAPQALRLTLANTKETMGELLCMSAQGGVAAELIGGTLSNEQLAQVHFELVTPGQETVSLALQDGRFYAGGLNAGTYVLRQTQIPQGFTLAKDRTVSVSGGTTTLLSVPLEECAVLTVQKTGLTFNDQLQTYVVPLTGEYGVYVMQDEQLTPYPSAANQTTVWANITTQQESEGRSAQIKLPADVDGTTYYIRELDSTSGFAPDTTVYALTLYAGQSFVLPCTVSSDRGFFTLDQLDITTGVHVSGGEFELLDGAGNTALDFSVADTAYQNTMAVPVGTYTLRQTQAAPGYALCDEPEIRVEIPPYLTQGGSMANVQMQVLSLPQDERIEGILSDVYAADEQGLTLISVDTNALRFGETLAKPVLEMSVNEESGARVNLSGVVLSGATDAENGAYVARVEYKLTGGGWQPSDARMTAVLDVPVALSLTDVEDDICAVRVTYIQAETGEEIAASGFTPGQMTVNVQTGVQGDAQLAVQAAFTGTLCYYNTFNGAMQTMERAESASVTCSAQGNGAFDTVSAGRDGRVTGLVFFDENANGLMDSWETGRYAGLTVSLIGQNGDLVESCRTSADGSYAFTPISGGSYTLQFSAAENVAFSRGTLYSEHIISGVEDLHYGQSAVLNFDGDHTDYVVQAGCIYAGQITGEIAERNALGELSGLGGLSVEMSRLDEEQQEPVVVLTDDLGRYAFTGVLPGSYEVTIKAGKDYLCEDTTDNGLCTSVTIEQGDEISLGSLTVCRAAFIRGEVRIDDDGDGEVGDDAAALSGVRVALLSVRDGYTEQIGETLTNEDGTYQFSGLYAGDYSVLFELGGEWTFTRYGAYSDVYGAVSGSGSTQNFHVEMGETVTDVNAGVTIPAQMSVTVFADTQVDGQMGINEQGLQGVTISLIRLENGLDAEEIAYKTDADGVVVFAGVSPGEYVLAYQMPGQWRTTKQISGASTNDPVSCVPQSTLSAGRSAPFALSMGQTGVRMYIGAMLSGSISGVVYYDDDANAVLSAQEVFCSGMQVELLDTQGTVLNTISSAADGSYAFEGLAPGRYRVRFTAQEDCGFSATERTMARGGAQNSDTSVTTTRTITVVSGETMDTCDAGVVRLGIVTGIIWEDSNANGIQDDGERVLSGVSVQMMNSTGRTILQTAQTDGQGVFRFERLSPNSYMLRVDAPDGYVFSGTAQGSALPLESQRDGRGYSSTFMLLGGARAENICFGLLTQGTIGGMIWLDSDYDGLYGTEQSGLRGANVTLLRAGEEIKTMQTPRSGAFTFDGLMPGDYTLRVALPDGYVFTADGGDSIAPHQDGSDTQISLGQLAMGTEMTNIRMGALLPASVGGVLWYDADNDGRRQTEDSGMVGAKVTLHMLDGHDAGLILETLSDETGSYQFSGVMPGSAQLTVTLPDGYAFAKQVSGTRRVSCVPQTDDVSAQTEVFAAASGSDLLNMDVGVVRVGTITGTVWEDSTYNGLLDASELGVAEAEVSLIDAASGKTLGSVITDEQGTYCMDYVRVGEYKLRVTLPEGKVFTRDGESMIRMADASEAFSDTFVLAMGESRAMANAGAITLAGVSGRIAVDENENGISDASEGGLSGAMVTVMQGGTVVDTMTTLEDGVYTFKKLRPGDYRVRVALPDKALFTKQSTLEMTNADAKEGESSSFTLNVGQRLMLEDISVVLCAKVTGRAWADENADGRMDAQEAALPGVLAELLNMENGGSTMASTYVNDSTGVYTFGSLRSGSYAVRFVLPEGELFADRLDEEGASCVEPVEGGTAVSSTFALDMGEQRTMNVGGIRSGEIGDTVWYDRDGNGLQDYREPPISGVTITLLHVSDDGQTMEVSRVQSDEYGYYHFRSLRPGDYIVRVELTSGSTLTYHFGEPLSEIDSDIDPDTGMSGIIHLKSGESALYIDIGFTQYE